MTALTNTMSRVVGLLSLCCVLAVQAGCQQEPPVSPEIAAARARILLKAPPGDPVLISDARTMPAESVLVIAGKIGVSGNPTWEKGRAMFSITDAHPKLAGHKHGEGEDESDCPFCKRSQSERIAIVQIVDQQGAVEPLDGKTLLGVDEGREILITGKGHLDATDMLVISADGIYIKP